MLNLNLEGKVAVVTGGSQGIGRGISCILAEAGAVVVVNHYDRDHQFADETVELIRQAGGTAEAYKANVADITESSQMFAYIADRYGTVDILVNNAGISTTGTLEELSYDEIDRVLDINLKGPFITCKEVIPYMLKQKGGRIINIASTSMYTGGGGGAHYAASKSGLMGLMRNLSKTYGGSGITINNLAISLIDTELFRNRYSNPADREAVIAKVPVGRAGTPEDVGYAVAFLASDWSGYINGEILQIDGGRMYV